MLATLRAGACTVPLSTYVTGQARAVMVKDSGSRLLFVSGLYAAESRALLAEMGLADSDLLPLDDASLDALTANESDMPPEIEVSPELGFNLIYSSGTTGIPKGILQSRRYRAARSGKCSSGNCASVSRKCPHRFECAR